jgi:peptide deformylase
MAIRPLVLYPDPVLLAPTLPVETVDDDVRALVRDMVETMYAAPGIGLAANQIGVARRVCIVDLSVGEEPGALHVFINPLVREASGIQVGEEGCLSFPDLTLDVERAEKVTVEALDLNGERFTLTVEGLLARAFLHEYEHLDGQTFLRNVSPLKRELVKKRIRKRIRSGDWVEAAAK